MLKPLKSVLSSHALSFAVKVVCSEVRGLHTGTEDRRAVERPSKKKHLQLTATALFKPDYSSTTWCSASLCWQVYNVAMYCVPGAQTGLLAVPGGIPASSGDTGDDEHEDEEDEEEDEEEEDQDEDMMKVRGTFISEWKPDELLSARHAGAEVILGADRAKLQRQYNVDDGGVCGASLNWQPCRHHPSRAMRRGRSQYSWVFFQKLKAEPDARSKLGTYPLTLTYPLTFEVTGSANDLHRSRV